MTPLFGITILVAFQRLIELRVAKRNTEKLLSQGARVIDEPEYFLMVLLHSTWLVTMLALELINPQEVPQWQFLLFLVIFLLGQLLRLHAIVTLKERWTTQVVILPKAPLVSKGLYRFIPHPNYLGVVLEIAALPLMGAHYLAALFFSFFNAFILYRRIKLENEALSGKL